jgi:RNA polymerase sigma-70 factor (ECF subfamily)
MLYFYLAMLETSEEQEKMTVLYKTYREYLLNIARKLLGNESDAEDVLHSAFVRVANNFTNIGEVSCHQTRNYLVIIVRGLALNLLRERRRANAISLDDFGEAEVSLTVEDQTLKQIEYEVLHQALDQLPPEYRDVLYLMYFEELSVKEIVKRINCSESAVKKRLERARQALGVILTEGLLEE